MSVEKQILKELERYNRINNYITEQEAIADPFATATPPATDVTAAPGVPSTPPTIGTDTTTPEPTSTPEVVDIETDTEVEKVEDTPKETDEEGTEELDITDLVKSQEDIQSKQDSYFEQLFNQLSNLESKLGEMDTLLTKVNDIESKIEKYRVKTPEEKLELRSLDSGPFNQKLTDFFIDKETEIEKSGKNEYVLTSDEVESAPDSEVRDTFDVSMPHQFKYGMR
jgi:hypothetical protein